ncbi:kif4a protein [Stylonychia lemnae]|uniref:Kinesin-like protein n=1 Tax=Stylonychia lemnae TaxID=5949 RepID=A0A078ALY5_STYLE|nr:kif4a protein [Stylonychia lemnae]|eukprot:CDW83370.1 kif4a protein [Stylonychia lemnae]
MNSVQAVVKIRPNILAYDPNQECILFEIYQINMTQVYHFDQVIQNSSDNSILFHQKVAPIVDQNQVKGILDFTAEYLQSTFQQKNEWLLTFTFVEIYNEQVRDLLNNSGQQTQLTIREDQTGKIQLVGAKEVSLSEIEMKDDLRTLSSEIQALILMGNKNKTVGATMANSQSSRSHSIFTMNLRYKNEESSIVSSKLNIIDLAGSERIQDTQAQGMRLKEACQINKSLSNLTEIVSQIASNKKRQSQVLRFRDSKLTFYLKDSLSGQSFILLIACISNEARFEQDSIRTIEFANNLRQIKTDQLKRNETFGQENKAQLIADRKRIKELEARVQELEHLLAYQSNSYSKIDRYFQQDLVDKSEKKYMLLQLLDVNKQLNQYLKNQEKSDANYIQSKVFHELYRTIIDDNDQNGKNRLMEINQTRAKFESKKLDLSKAIEAIFKSEQSISELQRSQSLININNEFMDAINKNDSVNQSLKQEQPQISSIQNLEHQIRTLEFELNALEIESIEQVDRLHDENLILRQQVKQLSSDLNETRQQTEELINWYSQRYNLLKITKEEKIAKFEVVIKRQKETLQKLQQIQPQQLMQQLKEKDDLIVELQNQISAFIKCQNNIAVRFRLTNV